MSERPIENAARWLQPSDGERDQSNSACDRYHNGVSRATSRVENAFRRTTLTSRDRLSRSRQLQGVAFHVKRLRVPTSAAISCNCGVKS